LARASLHTLSFYLAFTFPINLRIRTAKQISIKRSDINFETSLKNHVDFYIRSTRFAKERASESLCIITIHYYDLLAGIIRESANQKRLFCNLIKRLNRRFYADRDLMIRSAGFHFLDFGSHRIAGLSGDFASFPFVLDKHDHA